MSESIVHLIKHVNIRFLGHLPAGVIWINRQLLTSIFTDLFDFDIANNSGLFKIEGKRSPYYY